MMPMRLTRSAIRKLALLCCVLAAGSVLFVLLFGRDMRKEFPSNVWRIVAAPDKVEVLRTKVPLEDDKFPPMHGMPLFGADIVSGTVTPTPEWIDELRKAIASRGSYLWGLDKLCLPQPGVAVRFTREGEQADLLLCFECEMLSLGMTPPPGGGEHQKWLDFDRVNAKLVRLAKQALPDDAEIQSLKE